MDITFDGAWSHHPETGGITISAHADDVLLDCVIPGEALRECFGVDESTEELRNQEIEDAMPQMELVARRILMRSAKTQRVTITSAECTELLATLRTP